MKLRERMQFWAQMRADFVHTGAVQPSSRFLASVMVAPLRERRAGPAAGNARILEIGPGTGAVTRAIAARMGTGDELVCYEINAQFVRLLRQALVEDPILSAVADRTIVHNTAVQDMPAGELFDVAVCSAPLNNFERETIDAILSTMMSSLRPGGEATLFEYLLLPSIRRAFSRGASRRRLRQAEGAKASWLKRFAGGSSIVLRNIPPARVHRLSAG